jgi:predicted dienelactone hydrolase
MTMFRPRTIALSALILSMPLFGVLGPKAATAPTTPLPGYQHQSITAAHRPQPLASALWFPASGGEPTGVGGNALFDPTLVLNGAQPTGRDHPLVLISHGSGGNMDQMGWLASVLVARGAIVAGVNHAGSTSGDSRPLASTRVWDRAGDLRVVLDAVLADPEFGPRIDRRRITALGFSMGGATALHLAGARMDRAAFAAACARLGEKAPDCTFLTGAGIDIATLPAAWEGDMSDPRIGAVVAIDAGYGHAMTKASLSAIDIPTLLITLGGPGTPWRETGMGPEGANLAAKIPDARSLELAPAWHFSFLPPCGRLGPLFVWLAREEPICSDPAGTDRDALHDLISREVADFLDLPEASGFDPAQNP